MPRVAAIDCGTNSIRLLIADVAPDGSSLADVTRLMTVVRLGQGVDRTGELAPEALDRTFTALDQYAQLCSDYQVEKIRFVATSATRDARNRQVFVDGVRERLGVEPEVVSGKEEAELSFRGAATVAAAAPVPVLVVDLGGGSTELVLGDGVPCAAHSMDVGCVRITERHLHDDPPTAAQIATAREQVQAALDVAAQTIDFGQVRSIVGLAGSITTITAHALGLERYDREAINGATLTLAQADAAAQELLESSRAQRDSLGFMHPGRVDVIGAGALVWQEVMRRAARDSAALGTPVEVTITSEHDILDGIALSAL